MKVYIVDEEWYSADQGECKNTSRSIHGIYTLREKAVKLYSELRKKNRKWSYGYDEIRILEGVVNGKYEEKNISKEVDRELTVLQGEKITRDISKLDEER